MSSEGGSAEDGAPVFEMLVDRHGAVILRVCQGLVGPDDADDLWQETFLTVLRTLPQAAPVRNWEAWIVRIARNKCLDHLRAGRRRAIPGGDALDLLPDQESARSASRAEVAGGGEDAFHSMAAAQSAAVLWAALAHLPAKQREAVVYRHIAGLRQAEVAALLGNSEAAARRATADGMKALRALLVDKRGEFQ